ncbi:unnamed protein product [Brassicogethes aeneus]|uniref:Endonuclease-reverse transcriptase n=1 Tax=Brassicogethes aeneus TaxID=1431903 RepID=A0A9P0AYF1_BRAAE|nr:unnamed protein product [Brassicogethes aeneus]
MSDTNLILSEIINSKNELISKIEASETKLLLKIKELNRKTHDIETENKILKNKIEALEKKQKSNNIVIFGIKNENNDNIVEQTISSLNKLLQVEINKSDVNNVYQLGKKGPILVEFLSYLKKREILLNTQKLKGTNVYINHDQTLKERSDGKILRENLNVAKANPENECYIKNNKLIINKKSYTADQLIQENIEEIEIPRSKFNSATATPNPGHIEKVLEEENYSEKNPKSPGTSILHTPIINPKEKSVKINIQNINLSSDNNKPKTRSVGKNEKK